MAISASRLRKDVYRLLDEVVRTGQPLEIERHGQVLRITAAATRSRLERIDPVPELIVGEPQDLVSWDWSEDRRP